MVFIGLYLSYESMTHVTLNQRQIYEREGGVRIIVFWQNGRIIVN